MQSDSPVIDLTPPPRRLLRSEAYETIKHLIISGDYVPGTFLSERQLSAQLKMSKTPIRNALERLDTEGFVSISPQQGILVRELSFHEIADLFQIRLVLETFCVREIAGTISARQKTAIVELLTQQRHFAEQEDVEKSAALDLEFHMMLGNCLGNQEILRVMNQLRDKLVLIFAQHLHQSPARLLSNQQEHLAIAEAIFAGDGTLAARLMQDHLEYGRDVMLSRGRMKASRTPSADETST